MELDCTCPNDCKHSSDCAVHNEPASASDACNCAVRYQEKFMDIDVAAELYHSTARINTLLEALGGLAAVNRQLVEEMKTVEAENEDMEAINKAISYAEVQNNVRMMEAEARVEQLEDALHHVTERKTIGSPYGQALSAVMAYHDSLRTYFLRVLGASPYAALPVLQVDEASPPPTRPEGGGAPS